MLFVVKLLVIFFMMAAKMRDADFDHAVFEKMCDLVLLTSEVENTMLETTYDNLEEQKEMKALLNMAKVMIDGYRNTRFLQESESRMKSLMEELDVMNEMEQMQFPPGAEDYENKDENL